MQFAQFLDDRPKTKRPTERLGYGKQRGVPEYSIPDAERKVLADSGYADRNINFPYEPHEIDQYFGTLTATCPALSEGNAAMLRRKLSEVRPKKE